MLPAGWNTYAGTAIKVLSALIALLQWATTGHPPDLQSITGIFGLYATGDAISTSGQAKQSTLEKNTDITAAAAVASGVAPSVVADPPPATFATK
jgi:hypothetical protein